MYIIQNFNLSRLVVKFFFCFGRSLSHANQTHTYVPLTVTSVHLFLLFLILSLAPGYENQNDYRNNNQASY